MHLRQQDTVKQMNHCIGSIKVIRSHILCEAPAPRMSGSEHNDNQKLATQSTKKTQVTATLLNVPCSTGLVAAFSFDAADYVIVCLVGGTLLSILLAWAVLMTAQVMPADSAHRLDVFRMIMEKRRQRRRKRKR